MTFREKPITKLYAFALAAVFALVLAGCGGGGGSAAVEEEPPPMPEPPTAQEMCEGDGGRYNADGSCTSAEEVAAEMAEAEALSGAQEAAMAAYMAAMAAVSGAKDPVAMGNAQPYAAMAKEASDMAAAATTSEMAMEYQMKAEMYRDMAMEAAMDRGLGLTTLANKITNQSAIDNAELEGKTGDDVPDPVSNATRVGLELDTAAAAAPTVAATPEVPADTSVTPNTPLIPAVTNGTVDQGLAAGSEVSARVTHTSAGLVFNVRRGTANTDVMRGESPTSLTTRGGWMGAELVGSTANSAPGTIDGNMRYVNVYTDIQAPTQNYGAADATATDASIIGGVIVTGEVAGDGSKFAVTFNENPTDNNPPVAGQFQCSLASPGICSISVDESGKIVANTGYRFHRSTGTTKQDADYLAWGVWLTVPNAELVVAADGSLTNPADAGAFASGNDVFTVKAALKGTATYNGVATGLYSAGGMVEYFDADVTLNANFGGTVGADTGAVAGTPDDNLLGAVTGSVSNIMAGGMDVAGSLTLKKATIVDNTDDGGTADDGMDLGGFKAAVSGTLAGRAMTGNWGGQFYGPSSASGKAAETQYPTTAAGTFGASAPGNVNDPVRILGSFGAWKAE